MRISLREKINGYLFVLMEVPLQLTVSLLIAYLLTRKLRGSRIARSIVYLPAVISGAVGYGFARMRFPGRNILFVIVIASILIPWDVKIIPQFMQFSKLGWVNTYLPLIVPLWFGYPFYIFIFRQFILQVPYELDESGIIDGCSRLSVLIRIIAPLLKPPIITVLVLEFVRSWNDFLDPLIYLNQSSRYTLSLGIYYMITPYHMDWGAVMAASTLAVICPVLLFFLLQKYLLGGMSFAGMKE